MSRKIKYGKKLYLYNISIIITYPTLVVYFQNELFNLLWANLFPKLKR